MTLSQVMLKPDSAYPDALPAQYRLHWYVLERVLGQGGFGITYLAHDTNLDQRVAMKEYLPGEVAQRCPDATVRPRNEALGERYDWGLERFIAEARTLARFDHPNIVRVHSVFEANDTAYIVMRYEEGDNLAQCLERRGTLPEDELLRILLPILDGLERVHDAGFIHRDIKPANIHIRSDGSPVLLDFGSARQSLGCTRTVTILVAPGYAPLEQYYGDAGEQGPWTDIYGLAATCYRAIAGHAPVDAIVRTKGVLGSTREVLEPASAVGEGRYSARLLAAIDHGLELGEKDRPQSLAAWRREINGEGAVVVPLPRPRPQPQRPSAEEEEAEGSNPTPEVHRMRNRSALTRVRRAQAVWATGGAAVAAVAIALFVGMQDRKPDQKLDGQTRLIEEQRAQIEARLRELEEQRRREQQARSEALARQQEMLRQQTTLPASPSVMPEKPKRSEKPAAPVRNPARQPVVVPPSPQPDRDALAKVEQVQKPPEPPAKPTADDGLNGAERAMAQGDYASALRVVKPLAYEGNTRAQALLGGLYERGHGVTKNNNHAYMWYSLAARQGNGAAQVMKERVAGLLQQAEIRQTDRQVDAWQPRPGESGGEAR